MVCAEDSVGLLVTERQSLNILSMKKEEKLSELKMPEVQDFSCTSTKSRDSFFDGCDSRALSNVRSVIN